LRSMTSTKAVQSEIKRFLNGWSETAPHLLETE
jgi:hypothetical protein